ncbi:hypothetical protein GGS21DRAFT_542111 [Xylaria nigripes]|nr:hypothetical protein GGS21DRAFT_542111 [Xylaria nigripes]
MATLNKSAFTRPDSLRIQFEQSPDFIVSFHEKQTLTERVDSLTVAYDALLLQPCLNQHMEVQVINLELRVLGEQLKAWLTPLTKVNSAMSGPHEKKPATDANKQVDGPLTGQPCQPPAGYQFEPPAGLAFQPLAGLRCHHPTDFPCHPAGFPVQVPYGFPFVINNRIDIEFHDDFGKRKEATYHQPNPWNKIKYQTRRPRAKKAPKAKKDECGKPE